MQWEVVLGTRAPSGKYIPQRTRRAAGSPLGVPIRWDRHSLGRPEVLRRSPELSGGRIYRREQKNVQRSEKMFKFIAPLTQQLGVVYWLLEVLHELAATQMP